MRPLCASLLLLISLSAAAQIETAPVDGAPVPIPQPPEQGAPVPPPAAAAPRATEPPPVLPRYPNRRALDAAARGGSGGMSYAGPSGAINTSPHGAACAVTCSLQPPEEHHVDCPSGFTAFCQCDEPPFATCKRQ
jgi:hypothetical protein